MPCACSRRSVSRKRGTRSAPPTRTPAGSASAASKASPPRSCAWAMPTRPPRPPTPRRRSRTRPTNPRARRTSSGSRWPRRPARTRRASRTRRPPTRRPCSSPAARSTPRDTTSRSSCSARERRRKVFKPSTTSSRKSRRGRARRRRARSAECPIGRASCSLRTSPSRRSRREALAQGPGRQGRPHRLLGHVVRALPPRAARAQDAPQADGGAAVRDPLDQRGPRALGASGLRREERDDVAADMGLARRARARVLDPRPELLPARSRRRRRVQRPRLVAAVRRRDRVGTRKAVRAAKAGKKAGGG